MLFYSQYVSYTVSNSMLLLLLLLQMMMVMMTMTIMSDGTLQILRVNSTALFLMQ